MGTSAIRLQVGFEGATYRVVFCAFFASISAVAFRVLGDMVPQNRVGNSIVVSLPAAVTLLNVCIGQCYLPTHSLEEKWIKLLISAFSGGYVAYKLFLLNSQTELLIADIILMAALLK